MTHEELLAKINKRIDYWNIAEIDDQIALALRAVVELHSPEGQPTQQCRCCKKMYPCPTIIEIKKELK